MNEFERMQKTAQRIKEDYPPGTRIEMVHMNDPYSPIQAGTRGTVRFVDDIGTIFPDWDDGRRLGVCLSEDSIRKLSTEEIEAEQISNDENKGITGPVQSI